MSLSGTAFGVEVGDDTRSTQEVVGDLLERLLVWQARCTCATTRVTECPNYVAGDELQFNGKDPTHAGEDRADMGGSGAGGRGDVAASA